MPIEHKHASDEAPKNQSHATPQNNHDGKPSTDADVTSSRPSTEEKADFKNAPSGEMKKKKKKKPTVFVLDDRQQQSGSFSSDQGHAYVPRRAAAQGRPSASIVSRPPAQGRPSVSVSRPQSEREPNRIETKGSEDKIISQAEHKESVIGQIVQPVAPKKEVEKPQDKKSMIGMQVTPSAARPPQAGRPSQMSRGQQKAIIGTISTADYSRPMPSGRPSTISSQRPPRPEGGGRPGGRPGGAPGGRPSTQAGARGAGEGRRTPWRREEAPVVEEEITKSTGKRKTPKKKEVPNDKDRLEKKAGALRKRKDVVDYGTGDFDFGKKQKQKSLKYKEKANKEKSEKLDELLQREAVYIPEEITVKDFAERINKNVNEIIMALVKMGKMLSMNNVIDYETAALIAMDYEITIELESDEAEDHIQEYDLDIEDAEEDKVERAPVVTVMGHVDHGKTSLLDAIRNTGVASGEAGGITQHIGASEVIKNDKKILFLDTPGHEAFTSLRARGAQITDIAILVVAADDGVMPQTVEAIDHSKAAGVPIIVAINKIDKPTANPDRVKQELSEKGVLIEEWGGDVIAVPVSAKTGEGIDKLLDMVLIVAEVQDLKANPNRPAVGTVIEAKVVKGRGTVASILVEKGTLHQGDFFVAGRTYGKVKTMFNDKGKKIKSVGPSSSVEIDGISDIPQAGEKLYVTPDERMAKHIAAQYDADFRQRMLNKTAGVKLEQLFDKVKEGELKELNIIVKADVHGSVEALKTSLTKLSNEEVKVNVIRADVGTISESDTILASASDALIIGFNVRPSANVMAIADAEGVDIRTYSIIYQAIDDVEDALKGMLDPVFKEVVIGRAAVRTTFKIPGGVIAGCYVTNGKLQRNAQVRVIRDGIVLYTGKVSSLKRFKDDVREVAQGYECGLGIEKYTDIKEDDELEAFVMEEVKR